MTVIAVDGWTDFFVALAGAGAALAGLIVVAMSVTIKQILAYPSLPPRAAATISALVAVVVVSGIMLIPAQEHVWLGVELLLTALVALLPQLFLTYRLATQRPQRPFLQNAYKIAIGFAQALPFLVGAILILTGVAGGIGWLALGITLWKHGSSM